MFCVCLVASNFLPWLFINRFNIITMCFVGDQIKQLLIHLNSKSYIKYVFSIGKYYFAVDMKIFV